MFDRNAKMQNKSYSPVQDLLFDTPQPYIGLEFRFPTQAVQLSGRRPIQPNPE